MHNKKIVGICGSASRNSSNLAVLKSIEEIGDAAFDLEILDDLDQLPHFRTEITDNNVPENIKELRNKIRQSDGIVICTPEYVVSIPSRLKNLIEWCISETIFPDKPTGIITASARGEQGHEELKLIMKTLQTRFTAETTLLIQGVKGKIDKEGKITDSATETELEKFTQAFTELIK